MSARAWMVANSLALALLVVVLGGWARSRPDVRRRVAVGALCLLLLPVVFVILPLTGPPAWLRRLAWSCLALLTALAALLRVELLVLGAPAVALAAASVLGREAAVQRAARRVGGWLRALSSGRLGIFLLVCGPLAALEFL